MNLRNDQLLRGIHASKQRIPVYNLPRPELYIASLVILSQILFQPKTQQKTGTLYFVSIMYDIPYQYYAAITDSTHYTAIQRQPCHHNATTLADYFLPNNT
jgi:hypothetical protein